MLASTQERLKFSNHNFFSILLFPNHKPVIMYSKYLVFLVGINCINIKIIFELEKII